MPASPITNEEFIKRSRKKFKDRFEYLEVYVNYTTKIKIKCKHSRFSITPESHLKGNGGCLKCANEAKKANFVKKANNIHNYKYTYPGEYLGIRKHIEIICPKHGIFKTTPKSHLLYECSKCAGNFKGSSKLNFHEFKKSANKIHNYKYTYKKYKGLSKQIEITCPKHGKFNQSPYDHLRGHGCKKCNVGGCEIDNQNEILYKFKEIHGNTYDYSKFKYEGNTERSIIICPKHGEFLQNAKNHKLGCGCPKCAGKNKTTELIKEEFNLIHGQKYKYEKFKFSKMKIKSTILCRKHGKFLQTPACHLLGQGCPECAQEQKNSKLHNSILSIYPNFETEISFKKQRWDFKVKINNAILYIEIDGKQHFKKDSRTNLKYLKKLDQKKNSHIRKTEKCYLLRISQYRLGNSKESIKKVQSIIKESIKIIKSKPKLNVNLRSYMLGCQDSVLFGS